MVETITPVVHGGRRSRWAVFLALHVAGATVAAAAFGALLGALGELLGAPWGGAGLALVAVAGTPYLAREAVGLRVPVPQLRRQVPDWWRTFFPFGPASFLYGLGLGVGFLTFLSAGTLVVVAVAAAAGGRPAVGALLMGPFGFARGLSALVAMRARTPERGAELVGRLARSAGRPGWRVAHSVALVAVVVAALAAVGSVEGRELAAVAAAVLAVAFGAAGLAKLADARAWRLGLASYRLPHPVERVAAVVVPGGEVVIAALPLLGLRSTAGLVALVALVGFSTATVRARIRGGRRFGCGCFGAAPARDYRLLLARNALLGAASILAWRAGEDAPVVASLGIPAGSELLPAAIAVVGLGLAVLVGAQAAIAVRRGARR
jgi:hypothetical protein